MDPATFDPNAFAVIVLGPLTVAAIVGGILLYYTRRRR
jgi:hypothetical protein